MSQNPTVKHPHDPPGLPGWHAAANRRRSRPQPADFARRLLLTLAAIILISGCDSNESYSPTPNAARPWPRSLPSAPSADYPHAVSGNVFDAYSGVIANAEVSLFVETSRYGNGSSVATDQNGQFIGYLPDSKISVIAWKDGFVQPCAVSAEVRGSVALQIELTAEATLESASPPRPLAVNGISLTGTIFEMTNGFREPVAGAEVWIEYYDDIAVATTRSDLSGGYFACNLPTAVGIYVSKRGFRLAHVFVNPLQTPTRDIQLQRDTG